MNDRQFDAEIAVKVMGEQPRNPKDVPYYSTDVFDAYKIIKKFQKNSWNVSANHVLLHEGDTNFYVKFRKDNVECEESSSSLSMAICLAALALTEGKYTEIGNSMNSDDFIGISAMPVDVEQIAISDETILTTVKDALKRNKDNDNAAEMLLDILAKKGYYIFKDKNDE